MSLLHPNSDIQTIARIVQEHVNQEWEAVFQRNRQEMLDLYPKIGDSVYGMYGKRLFDPIHDQLKAAGLRATPRLPGGLNPSREWGAEDERQRWMWSKIVTTENAPIGTIVTVFFHDHQQIRIPRPFEIIALTETSKGAVVAALSQRSEDFKNAMEMREEIALYMGH